MALGRGIASEPLISAGVEPGTGGLFGWVSGGAGTSGAPSRGNPALRWPGNRTHLLQWRDARIR